MFRIAVTAITAAILLAGLAAAQVEVGAPLKQLCDKICGVWRSDDRDPVDVVYEFDAPSGLIRGRQRQGGANEGKVLDTTVIFGWDVAKKSIWMMHSGAGDVPGIGTASLTDKGYTYTIKLYGLLQVYTADIRFEGPDSYVEFFNFTLDNGTHGDGASGVYTRVEDGAAK